MENGQPVVVMQARAVWPLQAEGSDLSSLAVKKTRQSLYTSATPQRMTTGTGQAVKQRHVWNNEMGEAGQSERGVGMEGWTVDVAVGR